MKNMKNSIIEKLKQKVIRGFKPEVVLLDDVSKMLEDYVVISKQELREILRKAEEDAEELEGLLDADAEGYYKAVIKILKEILGES